MPKDAPKFSHYYGQCQLPYQAGESNFLVLFLVFLSLAHCMYVLLLCCQADDVPRKNPGKNQKRWKKADLLEWLKPKGVLEEGKKYTVKQLWEIIDPMIEGSDLKYTAERIMKEHGVICLRLPP